MMTSEITAHAALSFPAVITPKPAKALTLRLLSGLHAGAERTLAESDRVLVGGHPDCDIVLADRGVAPRHCVLQRRGRELSVLALESGLEVAGLAVAPGSSVALRFRDRVRLGEASFAVASADLWSVVDRDADDAAKLGLGSGDQDAGPGAPTSWLRSALVALACGAVAMTIAVFAFREYREGPQPGPGEWMRTVTALLEQRALTELSVAFDSVQGLRVTGVVPDAEAENALRASIADQGIPARIEVRSGEDIAIDVREVLRLSGMSAESRYLGAGQVEVRGAFGDGQALEALIGSRAMREVGGLKRVVAYNLDRPPEAPPPAGSKPKEVQYLVAGPDPYLVTHDGSRYYLGARLPNGERLIGIEGNDLLLERDGQVLRRTGPGTRLDSP